MKWFLFSLLSLFSVPANALNIGDPAPPFQLQTDSGKTFDLKDAKGKNWTVLYFYPKADSPGCTAQACAFRDAIKVIENQNAKLYGVSTDSQKDLQQFREHHKLNFELLSDVDGKVCKLYGTKIPLVTYSKRHTFLIDPNLIIRWIDRDVDPAKDAQKVADELKRLQKP